MPEYLIGEDYLLLRLIWQYGDPPILRRDVLFCRPVQNPSGGQHMAHGAILRQKFRQVVSQRYYSNGLAAHDASSPSGNTEKLRATCGKLTNKASEIY